MGFSAALINIIFITLVLNAGLTENDTGKAAAYIHVKHGDRRSAP